MNTLFTRSHPGRSQLNNRYVVATMTRSRASNGHADEMTAHHSWKPVTEAVHAKGGKIFAHIC